MPKAYDHHRVSFERDVLRLLDDGLSVDIVATRFGVGASTIRRIKRKYQPPASVPVPSPKVKVRRHDRRISPLRRQWLFHLLDMRAVHGHATDLAKLAKTFRTSEKVITETAAARKRLVPSAPRGGRHGDWPSEPL